MVTEPLHDMNNIASKNIFGNIFFVNSSCISYIYISKIIIVQWHYIALFYYLKIRF